MNICKMKFEIYLYAIVNRKLLKQFLIQFFYIYNQLLNTNARTSGMRFKHKYKYFY